MRRGVVVVLGFVVACTSSVDGTGAQGPDTGGNRPGSGSSSGSTSPSPVPTATGSPTPAPVGEELYVAFCTVALAQNSSDQALIFAVTTTGTGKAKLAPLSRDTREIPFGTGVEASWDGSVLSVGAVSIPAEANPISPRPMVLARATLKLTKTDRFHRCFTFEGEQAEPYAYVFKASENTCRLVKPAAGGTMPGTPDPDASPVWACP